VEEEDGEMKMGRERMRRAKRVVRRENNEL
jgi:hypothetical protein